MKLKPVALSLSQAEIDEIATELLEAMQPDWQNAVSLTLDQVVAGYVAPDNGMIVGYNYANYNGGSEPTINGIVVARSDYTSGGVSFTNVQCQVNKGDVFIAPNSNPGGLRYHFVPFKTSNPVSLRPLDPHKIDTAILNHWDDITSDFSTAGSTAGFVLDRIIYNPILRKLRINYHCTLIFGANVTKDLYLTYNGSDIPVFTNYALYDSCLIESDDAAAGFEDSYDFTSNKLHVNIYNRNGNTTWRANSHFTTQVEF